MTNPLEEAIAAAAEGGAPDGIALMRILAEAGSEDAARDGFGTAIERRRAGADAAGAARLEALRHLWAANPQAWGVVRRTLADVVHHHRPGTPDEALRYWAAAFDRAAAASPEASVALYSLGSPALLAAATRETVAFIERLGLLGSGRDALDLGCGIGRFLVALAPRVRSIVGLDISAGMVAEATRRTAGLANVRVARSEGDLAAVPDRSLDLVLAADVFPYLVQAGGTLAADHVTAFGRVLRPGGSALILNYAYTLGPDAGRQALAALADGAGLRLARASTGDVPSWDAAAFLLVRHS